MTDKAQIKEAVELQIQGVKILRDDIGFAEFIISPAQWEAFKCLADLGNDYLSGRLVEVASEEEIVKILEELATNQMKAVVKAVNKKGLMNTGWGDIDKEGGSLDFKVIAHALVGKIGQREKGQVEK